LGRDLHAGVGGLTHPPYFFFGSVCASSPFAPIPVKKSASGGSNFAAMAFDGGLVSCPPYGKILIEPGS